VSGPVNFKVQGLKELDAAFGEYIEAFDVSKATAKNVMKRAAIDAITPMADLAESLAPVLTGHLRDSITEGTKLTARQARLNRARDDKSTVEVSMGTSDPAGVQQEFGNAHQQAHPFMRPALDAQTEPTINRVSGSFKVQLDKATARARRKALKAASA